jgi:hypothetical protein
MKNKLPKPLKHVMLRVRHVLPAGCAVERGTLWVEPPGVECQGFRVRGPKGRFATLAISGDRLYMEFKIDDAHPKEVFGKTLDDGFVDSTTMLLRRLFGDGTPPS